MKVKQRQLLKKRLHYLAKAKTVKLKVKNNLIDGRWRTVQEAVHIINKYARKSIGYPVKEMRVGSLVPYYKVTIGYYLHAEITDLNEVWAKYYELPD